MSFHRILYCEKDVLSHNIVDINVSRGAWLCDDGANEIFLRQWRRQKCRRRWRKCLNWPGVKRERVLAAVSIVLSVNK